VIRNWDYLREYEQQRTAILDCVNRVFSSGRLILGRNVEEFERNFSSYCGVAYGIGVNSGTDALFLGLKALGIGTGDEVITVANTAVPTIAAIRATGARPVFADVKEDTFLMDIACIKPAISKRTRCIIPVHLFGQAVDMDPLHEIADAGNIFILEDCAQAAGAEYKGKKVGSLGNAAAFSFYPTKILGGFGDAGMVVTDCPELRDKLRRLRFYGMEGSYCAKEEGYNSRLDEVHAALLNFKLITLDEAVQKRREISVFYNKGLMSVGDIIVPAISDSSTHQFYAYTVRTQYRDQLREFLMSRGIETRINYPVPIHLMKGYDFLGYRLGALPVTERLAGEILSLPLFTSLTDEEVNEVVRSIQKFFQDL